MMLPIVIAVWPFLSPVLNNRKRPSSGIADYDYDAIFLLGSEDIALYSVNEEGAIKPSNEAELPTNEAIKPPNKAIKPPNKAIKPPNEATKPPNDTSSSGNVNSSSN